MVEQGSEWFLKSVLPMLRRKHPMCVDWAIALISGSFSFGRADRYSDFDGRVYLPEEVYRQFGGALSQDMEGCSQPEQEWSYAVLNLDDATPLCRLWRDPSDRAAWLEIDEGHLYYVLHWIVVHDPKAIARSFQKEAAYYPDEVYPLRLQSAELQLSRCGGLLHDAVSDADSVTAHIAMGAFLDAAMRLGFLWKRQYGPWAKWMYEAFLDLPTLGGDLGPLVLRAAQATDLEERCRLAEAITDYYEQCIPAVLRPDEDTGAWTVASEPARGGDRQEHLAALWYVLWEWTECNLHKAIARQQPVASYLYLTSSLLKTLYFGFYVLGRDWPPLLDLHRAFRALPGPVPEVVPAVEQTVRADSWEERQALMSRILSMYGEYMRQESLLPDQCIDTPTWVWSWLEHRKQEMR